MLIKVSYLGLKKYTRMKNKHKENQEVQEKSRKKTQQYVQYFAKKTSPVKTVTKVGRQTMPNNPSPMAKIWIDWTQKLLQKLWPDEQEIQ